MTYFCMRCRWFRLLGFNRVPASAARQVHIANELQQHTTDSKLAKEYLVSPGGSQCARTTFIKSFT